MAQDAKGGGKDKGEDKKAQKAIEGIGDAVEDMQKQLDKVGKLQASAEKKPDDKVTKSLSDEIEKLGKLWDRLEKAAKDIG